jgi:hypothetical protein
MKNLGFVVDRLKQLHLITDSSLERLTEEVACSTVNNRDGQNDYFPGTSSFSSV